MKTADLYLRVSTDEQAEKGYSLRSQKESLEKYCSLNDIRIREVFVEDYSAKTFKRPMWQSYLVYLKRNKSKSVLLLFTKWDRFSRNASDAYQMISKLKKQNIDPQAIEQPLDLSVPENKMMLAIYLTAPEVENDRRGLNTKVGIRQAKKEGRYTGKAPLGYVNRSYSDGRKYITTKEPDASVIKWVFEEYSTGNHSGEHLLKIVNEKGLKCSKNNFYHLLRNPIYMGKIIVPKFHDEPERLVDGLHKGIISEEIFTSVQSILNTKKKDVPKVTICNPDDLPLRGFINCPKCTRTLTGSASKGKSRYYLFYHCKSSCGVRYRAEEINDWFKDLLTSYIPRNADELKTEILDAFHSKTVILKKSRNEFISKIEDFNQKIEVAREMMLDDEIAPAEYRKIKELANNEIKLLESDLFRIEETPKINIKPIVEKAFKLFSEIDKLYEKSNLEQKKLIIQSIFPQKIDYKSEIGRTQKSNFLASTIYLKNSELRAKKKGQNHSKMSLSHTGWLMGLEPTTLGTTNQYSNQLSYSHRIF